MTHYTTDEKANYICGCGFERKNITFKAAETAKRLHIKFCPTASAGKGNPLPSMYLSKEPKHHYYGKNTPPPEAVAERKALVSLNKKNGETPSPLLTSSPH